MAIIGRPGGIGVATASASRTPLVQRATGGRGARRRCRRRDRPRQRRHDRSAGRSGTAHARGPCSGRSGTPVAAVGGGRPPGCHRAAMPTSRTRGSTNRRLTERLRHRLRPELAPPARRARPSLAVRRGATQPSALAHRGPGGRHQRAGRRLIARCAASGRDARRPPAALSAAGPSPWQRSHPIRPTSKPPLAPAGPSLVAVRLAAPSCTAP